MSNFPSAPRTSHPSESSFQHSLFFGHGWRGYLNYLGFSIANQTGPKTLWRQLAIDHYYLTWKLWTLFQFLICIYSEGYQVTSLQKWFAQGLKTRANDISADFKVASIKGRYLQKNYNDEFFFKARNLAWKLRTVFDEALTKVDVLIMPTNPKKARPLPLPNIPLRGNFINLLFINLLIY